MKEISEGAPMTVLLPKTAEDLVWNREASLNYVLGAPQYESDLKALARSNINIFNLPSHTHSRLAGDSGSVQSLSGRIWDVRSDGNGAQLSIGGVRLLGRQILVENGVVHFIDGTLGGSEQEVVEIQNDPTDESILPSAAVVSDPNLSLSALVCIVVARFILN